jgi:AraC-like DNA-binding protein
VPLARIAEQVEYESEAAFNRAFKRSYGLPLRHGASTGRRRSRFVGSAD